MSSKRAAWCFTLLIMACALGDDAAGNGIVSGMVRAKPRVQSPRSGASGYGENRRAVLFDYDHLKDVVVYAESDLAPGGALGDDEIHLKAAHRRISFAPAFSVCPASGTVRFYNEADDELHVYSGGESPASIVLALPPRSEGKLHLTSPGFYRLYLVEDADAQSGLFMAGNHIVKVDSTGHYELSLPAGKYRVTAWHGRLPSATESIEIKDGDKLKLDFELSVKQLPQIP